MKKLILGTAGHIDHGKTSLVHALTGINTDRLKEEQERGITIDLGFAEFFPRSGFQFGVVDVPGHEGFIRNMVAGATGMDLVMLAIASDEGVMPQTHEHLDILQILGVKDVIVAMTKADLVEKEWMELVAEDIRQVLKERSFLQVPVIPTSVITGIGLEEIVNQLVIKAEHIGERSSHDLTRMPVDRVFSIRGTGTVATGTLWSGQFEEGGKVVFQPSGIDGRIRGIQVHGKKSEKALAGERTAIAITGASVSPHHIRRGQVVVDDRGWRASSILTVKLEVLEGSPWKVKHGQRLRVHLGTDEVMARTVLLGQGALKNGEKGWVQLRLESSLLARVKDRLVIRSYSPVTTIGGAVVGEIYADKRKVLDPSEVSRLDSIINGETEEVLKAVLDLASWHGVPGDQLPVSTGYSPNDCKEIVQKCFMSGVRETSNNVFGIEVVAKAKERLEKAVDEFHRDAPLARGVPIESIRNALPVDDGGKLVDLLIDEMVQADLLNFTEGLVSRVGHVIELSSEQEVVVSEILKIYENLKLEAPEVPALPDHLTKRRDLWAILKYLEIRGDLITLDQELLIKADILDNVVTEVIAKFGGQDNLSPSQFKVIIPVSRKHLIPILSYMDRVGVTVRKNGGRLVIPGNKIEDLEF